MTWQKLGREFWDDCARAGLSDAAVRTHGEAIGWVYQGEDNDLRIQTHLVRRFAGSPDYAAAVDELLDLGFWASNGTEYTIVHHAEVIRESLTAQRKKRDRDRRAQDASRRRARADVSADSATDQPNDVSADVSAGISDAPSPDQTRPDRPEQEAHDEPFEEVLNGTRWRISGARI